jgi:hypothetical protein
MRSRSDAPALHLERRLKMDQEKPDAEEDLPHQDQKRIEQKAEQNRKEMDDVPPHGTDPLHEGP